jgi:hypothetical protein
MMQKATSSSEWLARHPGPPAETRDTSVQLGVRFSEAVEKRPQFPDGEIPRVDAEQPAAADLTAGDEAVTFQAAQCTLHDDERSAKHPLQLAGVTLLEELKRQKDPRAGRTAERTRFELDYHLVVI